MPPTITASEEPVSAQTAPVRKRHYVHWVVRGATLLVVFLLLLEIGRTVFGSNFHTVLPGRVYRCAQPSAEGLEKMVRAHGIRTVINLRGRCYPFAWYLDECRATQTLDVCQEDICFSAGRLPSRAEMRRLIEVLDHAEYPVVLHCRRGADRTGMAAAIVLLLQSDLGFEEARRQLGLRFGHVPLGRPAQLDAFFDLYAEWLGARGITHSPETFRRWATQEYSAGEFRAAIELLEAGPIVVRKGEPAGLRVRARNLGVRPWRFSALSNAGVHVGFHIWDEKDKHQHVGKAGLFDAEVAPEESIEVTVVLPALKQAGRYRLMIDLHDERQGCWFFQVGSEPLEEELHVHE